MIYRIIIISMSIFILVNCKNDTSKIAEFYFPADIQENKKVYIYEYQTNSDSFIGCEVFWSDKEQSIYRATYTNSMQLIEQFEFKLNNNTIHLVKHIFHKRLPYIHKSYTSKILSNTILGNKDKIAILEYCNDYQSIKQKRKFIIFEQDIYFKGKHFKSMESENRLTIVYHKRHNSDDIERHNLFLKGEYVTS